MAFIYDKFGVRYNPTVMAYCLLINVLVSELTYCVKIFYSLFLYNISAIIVWMERHNVLIRYYI